VWWWNLCWGGHVLVEVLWLVVLVRSVRMTLGSVWCGEFIVELLLNGTRNEILEL
jgi:hypothetical protein